MKFKGHTVAGEDYPERNKDAMAIIEPSQTVAVFDGVGASGGDASSVAAQVAVQVFVEKPSPKLEYLEQFLQSVSSHIAKSEAFDLSTTTAVIARVVEDRLQVAHSGDSRAWRWHKTDGLLECLTLDHGLSDGQDEREAWRQQELLSRVAEPMELEVHNPRDLIAFNRRNVITSCLGHNDPAMLRVRKRTLQLQPDHMVLLTTDGIHDNLTHEQIREVLADQKPEDVPDMLIAEAQKVSRTDSMRAKKDDMTAIVGWA